MANGRTKRVRVCMVRICALPCDPLLVPPNEVSILTSSLVCSLCGACSSCHLQAEKVGRGFVSVRTVGGSGSPAATVLKTGKTIRSAPNNHLGSCPYRAVVTEWGSSGSRDDSPGVGGWIISIPVLETTIIHPVPSTPDNHFGACPYRAVRIACGGSGINCGHRWRPGTFGACRGLTRSIHAPVGATHIH